MEWSWVVGCHCTGDVKDCMLKIHKLNYAEEACYNGTLVIKAFSSGTEIGSCNWILGSPKGDITYLSGSNIISAHAMPFDYRSLQGTCALIYSDFLSFTDTQDGEDGDSNSVLTADKLLPMSSQDLAGLNHKFDENLEEKKKLVFICSCAIDCINEGCSVLIPIDRLGTVLLLLEEMTTLLEASDLRVSYFFSFFCLCFLLINYQSQEKL
ncbi:integrator complex subunit 9-like isoform X1 [Cajanus cajan]|uniref:integrator complex subunit 9-like isoform X1 n=1 Tax=Cajanus cajan TaxID=3821 RepID=UPI0010FB1CB5|nr:integrator complex subunit 9-like isoform X1 [Cajanus cajan]